jgi:hypothetical protein
MYGFRCRFDNYAVCFLRKKISIFQPLWAGNHFKTETERFDFKQFFDCDRVAIKQHPELAKLNVLRSCNFSNAPVGGVKSTLKPKLNVSILNNFLRKLVEFPQTTLRKLKLAF